MYYPIQGSKFFVSTGLDGAKTITDISNAAPPVFTSTAHGYSNNDEVFLEVGWEDFNYSVFRVGSVAANTAALPGYDSTNTDWYPAGSDTGTAKKISGWQEIGQVLAVNSSGGDVRNETVTPFDKRNAINIPVGFNAASLSFTLGYDPARADQVALLAASRILGKKAFKFLLPGGAYAYCYGTVAMSSIPKFENVLKRDVAISIDGLFTNF